MNKSFFFQAINTAKLENVYGELNTKVEVLKKEASFAVSRLGWTPDKARREYTKAVSLISGCSFPDP